MQQKKNILPVNDQEAVNNTMAVQATAAFSAAANDNQTQTLELGQQLADGSYVVGFKTNAKGKQEALLLFLDNAEDIQDKGLMTHNQAEKAFRNSKGHKGHKASAFQTPVEIHRNESDGGIRQFTPAEFDIIFNNFKGKGLDEKTAARMAEIWQLTKHAVTQQGYDLINTAPPRGYYEAVFRDIHNGIRYCNLRDSDPYSAVLYYYGAVLSGRSTPRP